MGKTDSRINCFISDHENLGTVEGDHSKIKKLSFTANGQRTDVVLCDYINKQFLVITQYQKFGTFILVSKGNSNNPSEAGSFYDVRTIGGVDNQEYFLAARYLAEQLNILKPVLFSICLQDHSLEMLRLISRALKQSSLF